MVPGRECRMAEKTWYRRIKSQTKLSRKASLRKGILSKDQKEMKELVMEQLFKQREQSEKCSSDIQESQQGQAIVKHQRDTQEAIHDAGDSPVLWYLVLFGWRRFTKIRIMIHSAFKRSYGTFNSNIVICYYIPLCSPLNSFLQRLLGALFTFQ